jgi:GTPase SAR1 family protein
MRASLQSLSDWAEEVKSAAPRDAVRVVVGNKNDLTSERQVDLCAGEDYTRALGAEFFVETSALTGSGIDELFGKIAMVPLSHSGDDEQPESPQSAGDRNTAKRC